MPSLLRFSMAQEEEENDLEAKFDAAVKVIWSLPEEGDNLSLLLRSIKTYVSYNSVSAGVQSMLQVT